MSTSSFEERIVDSVYLNRNVGDCYEMTHAGAVWDVFRRHDVPKLIQYLRNHTEEFGSLTVDQVSLFSSFRLTYFVFSTEM